jgi:hypothetical protein
VGLNFDAGVELWVSPSWGLGPGVRVFYFRVPDDSDSDDAPIWHGYGAAAFFGATFQ